MKTRTAVLGVLVVVAAVVLFLLLRNGDRPGISDDRPIDEDVTLRVGPAPQEPCERSTLDRKKVARFHPRRQIQWRLQGCGGWGLTIQDIRRSQGPDACDGSTIPADADFRVTPPSGTHAPVVNARLFPDKPDQDPGTKEYYCYTLMLKPPDGDAVPIDPEIEIIWP